MNIQFRPVTAPMQFRTIVFAICLATVAMQLTASAQDGRSKTRKEKEAEKPAAVLPNVAAPTGPRLCEIAPPDGSFPLLVGGTISSPLLGTSAESVINREFRFITPANAFKQTAVHPEPGKWNWKKADMWVDRCEERGEIMRLHACVGPQCSAWVEEDDRKSEELRLIMEQYVRGVCKRYADRKTFAGSTSLMKQSRARESGLVQSRESASGRIRGLRSASMKLIRCVRRCT